MSNARGPHPSSEALILGSLGIVFTASSGVLITLSGLSPGSVVLYRFAYALPMLAALALVQQRYAKAQIKTNHLMAAAAGAFFALDFLAYSHAIEHAGAGIATVLSNLSIVFVGMAAWFFWGERPKRRLIVAVALIVPGAALAGGAIGGSSFGDRPALGIAYGLASSVAYGAFFLLFRKAVSKRDGIVRALLETTAVAALITVPFALVGNRQELIPSWPDHGWVVLQAGLAQVAGWLFLAVAIPKFSAVTAAVLLLLQPITALLLAAVILEQIPSVLQTLGCAIIVGAIGLATVPATRSAPRWLANG